MTNITTTLKNSIALEESKRSPMNLKNHSCEDLSLMIGLIEKEREDLQRNIDLKEQTLSDSEDMSEYVENQLIKSIGSDKKQIDQLIAWRKHFLDAWTEVKMKK